MQVFLVWYGERDGRRLNDLHAETMFIRAQPIDRRSTIRVKLGEILQLSIRDIVKPLQPRRGKEPAELTTGHNVRAFTFSYFGISSRLFLNELALLILEIKLAITRGIVALIEAMLPQSQERCILQKERNIPFPRQSLTYLRLRWALPSQPAGFEQAVRHLESSSRGFFLPS
jgi:hypothetical protein